MAVRFTIQCTVQGARHKLKNLGAGALFSVTTACPFCFIRRPSFAACRSKRREEVASRVATLQWTTDDKQQAFFYLYTRSPKYGKFMVFTIGLMPTLFLPA